MPAIPLALRLRPVCAQDEALLFELFAADKRAELAAAGMTAAQVEMLIQMQYRGRKRTYAVLYPEAEDSILIAEDSALAGRLLLHRGENRWRIVDIAVLPPYRSRGLGTAVLKECQAQCARAGARLELQVAKTNPARLLYERMDFRAAGEDAMAIEMVWSAGRWAASAGQRTSS